jgi:hypothetical protein
MAELPRFSRNYGRSGAYESPATVVDTKTAQIWANVIDNIGKQTQARLASKRKAEAAVVKETQDKIAYSIEQRKENAKEVYKFLGVNGLNNPYLIDYATEQIDTLTKIDMDSYKATDPRQANEFAKQYDAQFQSMLTTKKVIGLMKESDVFFKAGLDSESTVLGVGSPGGLSAYSEADRQYLDGRLIRAGLGQGGVERLYEEDGVMMVEYKGGVAGKKGFTAVAEEYFSYIPETVPDDKADLTSRLQKSNVITKDLTISPTLREKQNGEDVVTSDIDRDTQSLVTFSPLNTSQIAASSATISKALATNRLMSVAAQNSYTQNVRPFLKSRGITQENGSDWPEELETGNGINGKSFYSDKSQGIYKQALTAYTENMFGLNKTNQVISTTKLTDSEFKRRLGITDDNDEEKTQPFATLTEQAWRDGGKEKIIKSFFDGSKENISLTVTDFIKRVGAPNKIEGFDRDGAVGIKIGVTGRRAGETVEILATENPNEVLKKIQYALTGDATYLLPVKK